MELYQPLPRCWSTVAIIWCIMFIAVIHTNTLGDRWKSEVVMYTKYLRQSQEKKLAWTLLGICYQNTTSYIFSCQAQMDIVCHSYIYPAATMETLSNIANLFLSLLSVFPSHQLHKLCFNTMRPRQNGHHFGDDIFKRIFLNENLRFH